MSPAGVAKLDKKGAKGLFNLNTTVKSSGVSIVSIAEKKKRAERGRWNSRGDAYRAFFQSEFHRLRIKRCAIVELNMVAQLKGISQPIVADLP
jgi:hypothetical protein